MRLFSRPGDLNEPPKKLTPPEEHKMLKDPHPQLPLLAPMQAHPESGKALPVLEQVDTREFAVYSEDAERTIARRHAERAEQLLEESLSLSVEVQNALMQALETYRTAYGILENKATLLRRPLTRLDTENIEQDFLAAVRKGQQQLSGLHQALVPLAGDIYHGTPFSWTRIPMPPQEDGTPTTSTDMHTYGATLIAKGEREEGEHLQELHKSLAMIQEDMRILKDDLATFAMGIVRPKEMNTELGKNIASMHLTVMSNPND